MLMYYAFTSNTVFKSVPPLGSEPTWQSSILYSDIVALIYVNKTICMVICPSTRFKLIILWPKMNHLVPRLSQNASYGWGPGAILSFKTFLSFINRLLVTIYGEGNGIPLQYPCLENPTDGRAWKAAVHGVAEGQTQLSDFTLTFHFHALEKEMATCSSILAWRIPGTGEPGGLLSMGSHRVGHDWSDLAVAVAVTI